MTKTQYTHRGDTVGLVLRFYGENGTIPVDPDAIEIQVHNPDQWWIDTIETGDPQLNRIQTGVYKFEYTMPETAMLGLWQFTISAIRKAGDIHITDIIQVNVREKEKE